MPLLCVPYNIALEGKFGVCVLEVENLCICSPLPASLGCSCQRAVGRVRYVLLKEVLNRVSTTLKAMVA